MVAAEFAAGMLPGFSAGRPGAGAAFGARGAPGPRGDLAELPAAVFTSDDALGWVYQYWQTKKKKEVNESERKIGGADMPR